MMTMVDTGLRIDVEHRPREVVMALRGELDLANVDTLRQTFANLDPAYGAAVIVDCGHLSFIGAAGIGALARAACELRAEGHSLQLVRSSPFVRHLFQLSGLGFLMPEPETPDSARACRRPPKLALAVPPVHSPFRPAGTSVAV